MMISAYALVGNGGIGLNGSLHIVPRGNPRYIPWLTYPESYLQYMGLVTYLDPPPTLY